MQQQQDDQRGAPTAKWFHGMGRVSFRGKTNLNSCHCACKALLSLLLPMSYMVLRSATSVTCQPVRIDTYFAAMDAPNSDPRLKPTPDYGTLGPSTELEQKTIPPGTFRSLRVL